MLQIGISAILTILAIIVVIKVTGKVLKLVITLALVAGIVYFVSSFIANGCSSLELSSLQTILNGLKFCAR